MKVRINYVSNSSSSSFIVYGKKLDYYDALELMKENSVICILDRQGISGEVEDFVFEMTDGRLKKLEKNGIDVSNGEFILVMEKWDNGEEIMDVLQPLTGGRFFEVTKDESSPNTLKDNDKNFVRWVKSKAR